MELPITEKDFEKILEVIKGVDYSLYAKLWTYKMNYLNMERKDGLS